MVNALFQFFCSAEVHATIGQKLLELATESAVR